MQPFGLGANHSPKDYRTLKYNPSAKATPNPIKGGVIYDAKNIEHQHIVGICTAISIVQSAEKATGKKYSPDFQYLIQKKFYDYDWNEGSSIFHGIKSAYDVGFLPLELSPFTEADRNLPYPSYIAKLQSISNTEIERLKKLCEKVMTSYDEVVDLSANGIASAINSSDAGIICRYDVGEEWWIPSWNPKDINPLRAPKKIVSGHAIIMSSYDYSASKMQVLANTWGTLWCKQGTADINFDTYRPTEAFIPHYSKQPNAMVFILPKKEDFKPVFAECKLGDNNNAVKDLQVALMILGYLALITPSEWGNYGPKTRAAVYKLQLDHIPNLSFSAKYVYRGQYCSNQTISALNKLFVK